MMLLPTFDTLLYNSQRQGRCVGRRRLEMRVLSSTQTLVLHDIIWCVPMAPISDRSAPAGEEAAVVCSAAAWSPTDEVFAQYREQGVLMWRGMPCVWAWPGASQIKLPMQAGRHARASLWLGPR
jgi:hypothetical protein